MSLKKIILGLVLLGAYTQAIIWWSSPTKPEQSTLYVPKKSKRKISLEGDIPAVGFGRFFRVKGREIAEISEQDVVNASVSGRSQLIMNGVSSWSGRNIYVVEDALPIYDLRHAQYTSKFAEDYDYPKDFVGETPEAVAALTFTMRTTGDTPFCYLGMLIDKSIELDFDVNYLSSTFFSITNGPGAFVDDFPDHPDGKKAGVSRDYELKQYQIDHGPMNSREGRSRMIFGSAYQKSAIDGEHFSSVMTTHYQTNFFKEYNYIRFGLACHSVAIWGGLENLFIFVAKKTSPDVEREFHPFNIPQSFRQRITDFGRFAVPPIDNGDWARLGQIKRFELGQWDKMTAKENSHE